MRPARAKPGDTDMLWTPTPSPGAPGPTALVSGRPLTRPGVGTQEALLGAAENDGCLRCESPSSVCLPPYLSVCGTVALGPRQPR